LHNILPRLLWVAKLPYVTRLVEGVSPVNVASIIVYTFRTAFPNLICLPNIGIIFSPIITLLYTISLRRELEFARLEQLLREANERAEQERRRAEEADERAEDERRNRKEADERAELERRRAEDERRNQIAEEKKTRPTIFEEYLRACHILFSKPLQIQTDKSLSI